MSWKIPATLFFLEPTVGQEKKNEENRREKRA
jgi:hypothetical protein